MNIHGLNWGNRLVQTRTEPAGAGFCWNRYIRNGPKTEPLLTLGVVYVYRDWAQGAQQRYCGAGGGGCSLRTRCLAHCLWLCVMKFGQRLAIISVSHRESASARAFSFVGIYTQCSSIFCSAMWIVICLSKLIACPLILPFACAAMTASLSWCSLIFRGLDWGMQVHSACSTAYIALKLLFLALCRCGTVIPKSWTGVCMPDRVSPGLTK